MTQLEATQLGTLEEPVPITSFPFAQTIDVSERTTRPNEPSPCLPSATSVWYAIRPGCGGRLVLDLAGSTPLDPVIRLYRRDRDARASLVFIGCASPLWNAQSTLDATVGEGETLLAQVGTSESLEGRLVVRAELHD